jgi:hypothetical protein
MSNTTVLPEWGIPVEEKKKYNLHRPLVSNPVVYASPLDVLGVRRLTGVT